MEMAKDGRFGCIRMKLYNTVIHEKLCIKLNYSERYYR